MVLQNLAEISVRGLGVSLGVQDVAHQEQRPQVPVVKQQRVETTVLRLFQVAAFHRHLREQAVVFAVVGPESDSLAERELRAVELVCVRMFHRLVELLLRLLRLAFVDGNLYLMV